MKEIAQIIVLLFIGIIAGIIIGRKTAPDTTVTNSIQFVWEGLEKDIPEDGSYIQITGTDENTVYINNIDE